MKFKSLISVLCTVVTIFGLIQSVAAENSAVNIIQKIDLSKCSVYYLSGEKGDGSAKYRTYSGNVSNLYDNDKTTAIASGQKIITAFDLTEYNGKIQRIEYSINSTASAGANFLYGAQKLDDDTSSGAVSSVAWQTIYRTNDNKASGISVESTIDIASGSGTAVITGDFSDWNYIGVANGSAICGCSELEIYIKPELPDDYYSITSENINIDDYGCAGQLETFTVPENMVKNSLVVTYNDGKNTIPVPITDNENGSYSFTMPAYDVQATCLTDSDPNKLTVVGTTSTYYTKNDSPLRITFNIPRLGDELKYSDVTLNVPVRTHGNNARNMKASFNGMDVAVNGGTVNGSVSAADLTEGSIGTLVLTNENSSGVDYFHDSDGHYPATAKDLATAVFSVVKTDIHVSGIMIDGEQYSNRSIIPNGSKITGIMVKKNLEYTVPADISIYAAVYNGNGILESVRKIDGGNFESEEETYDISDFSLPESAEYSCQVKIFIWDSMKVITKRGFTVKTTHETEDSDMGIMSLWYDEPAAEDNSKIWNSTSLNGQNNENHVVWKEKALPIGNGYMGAMIYGGVAQELISLNEKTLWQGKPNHISDDRSEYFKQAREAILAGNAEESKSILAANLAGSSSNYGSYTSFGNLMLNFTNIDAGTRYADYRRWLDLDNSKAGVEYTVDGVTYRREYFASYPDRLMAVKLTSNVNNQINFSMSFTNQPNLSRNIATEFDKDTNTLQVTGELSNNGLKWGCAYKIINNGGSVSCTDGVITVSDADEAEIIMTLTTNYRFSEEENKNGEQYRTDDEPGDIMSEILSDVECEDFDELYKTHIEDYKNLYDNVKLEISDANNLPTDTLRAGYDKTNTASQNRMLDQLFYQYGRYMMISSSRAPEEGANTLPANLQGVWNDQEHPQWESDYHINVNLQMNYYPAANGNLIECMEPLLDWVEQTMVTGKQTAKTVYGCNGWVSHTCNNAFGFTDPGWGITWGLSPESSAWICLNCWDMYDYTRDVKYLPRIYNVIQEAVRFYSEYLYYDEKTGEYIAGPSYSPEQTDILTMGAKIDQQLIKQLYGIYLEASEIDFEETDEIKKDAVLIETVKGQINKLQTPVKIGEWGNIMEWNTRQAAKYEENSDHRHISHLVSLYPCNQISRRTPDLLDAAKVTLNARGDVSTGWSRANKAMLWSRAIGNDGDTAMAGGKNVKGISNGDRAYSIYQGLIKEMVFDNLFDFHQGSDDSALNGIFQIDGNFGSTAAMGEFLMQSHDGYIDILPSLPTAWSDNGAVKGLLARGAFDVSIDWQNQKPVSAVIKSNAGNVCRIFKNSDYGDMTITSNGKAVNYKIVTEDGLNIIEFNTDAGMEYNINY